MGAREMKYCIQKHQASHLHYDLRLEYKGKAKSWAVPKLPPRKVGLKRLAVQVPDHAVSYMKFSGEIIEGYGKGKVEIWDSGTWTPEKVEAKKIVGVIKGKKLNGRYTLINFKGKNWLFFKNKT